MWPARVFKRRNFNFSAKIKFQLSGTHTIHLRRRLISTPAFIRAYCVAVTSVTRLVGLFKLESLAFYLTRFSCSFRAAFPRIVYAPVPSMNITSCLLAQPHSFLSHSDEIDYISESSSPARLKTAALHIFNGTIFCTVLYASTIKLLDDLARPVRATELIFSLFLYLLSFNTFLQECCSCERSRYHPREASQSTALLLFLRDLLCCVVHHYRILIVVRPPPSYTSALLYFCGK